MSSTRITFFDTWQAGYGLATVRIVLAGTDTLASVFTDEGLTSAAANPQTLSERILDGISYGRFGAPLYVGVSCQLLINSVDQTGVIRVPLTTLAGQDASLATVTVDGGSEAITLEDRFAWAIDVRDYGEWLAVGETGASASTNNATLVEAIAVASSDSGGYVDVPDGTYQITTFTVPAGVVLRGKGRGATILQSTFAGGVVVIGGNRAGLHRITIDGVTLVSGSAGVSSGGKDEVILDDVEIKRFETGLACGDGKLFNWRDLFISTCVTGYSAFTNTDGLRFNKWTGGKVELCTSAGISLLYITAPIEHQIFENIVLDTNTGIAVVVNGARHHSFLNCRWIDNTVNLAVSDASPATTSNTVIGLDLVGGAISAGSITLTGNLENIVFRRMELTSVAVTLTTPTHLVLVEDCHESGLTVVGTPSAWTRRKSTHHGAGFTVTTDATVTKAWGITLTPGQHVNLEAKVIGRARNNGNTAHYHFVAAGQRSASTLAYDAQSANFTLAQTVTGTTSGATARIIADSDSGATGTLSLHDIVGAFLDNEIITDGAGGSATANGTLSHGSCAIQAAQTAVGTPYEDVGGWDANFVANGPEIELRVTGSASNTVEWTCHVEALTNDVSTQ